MTALLPQQEALVITAEDKIRQELAGIITWHARHHPRNLQKELGPSEVGHPCARKLVSHMIDAPRSNPGFDPLPSEIGIGYHARLQEHFDNENARIGRERWLTEARVEPWPGLSGSCDLFDTDGGRVIDWKILGDASYKKTSRQGPILSYRRQLQLYGRGYERQGYDVKEVVLAVLPKAGTLAGIYVWRADYDPQVAADLEARWVHLLTMADVMQVEQHPDRLTAFETADENCQFCGYFNRTPEGPYQCGGHNRRAQ